MFGFHEGKKYEVIEIISNACNVEFSTKEKLQFNIYPKKNKNYLPQKNTIKQKYDYMNKSFLRPC